MRVPSNLKSGDLGFNMTPMIDVVFLLIIFFLVSSHLAKQETQMELDLPDVAGPDDGVADDQQRRLVINILPDGNLHVTGHRVSADQLQQKLIEQVSKAGKDIEVRIRSDRRAPYSNVEPVMLACARAGIWNVTFAVIRTEDVKR